jgi:hypothetical protein
MNRGLVEVLPPLQRMRPSFSLPVANYTSKFLMGHFLGPFVQVPLDTYVRATDRMIVSEERNFDTLQVCNSFMDCRV